MNKNVPFPRAGGTWHHNAKTGALAPADAEQPATTPTPATPDAPAPKAERKPTRRNRAAD